MADDAPSGTRVLIVGLRSGACALPLADVIEIMRPRTIEAVDCDLPFVQGVCIIRGLLTPVVNLNELLGMPGGPSQRFVTIRLGDRQVALSVDGVTGIRDFDALTLQEIPPLLAGISKDVLDAVGTVDEKMLMVLKAGWRLPDAAWQAVAAQQELNDYHA